MALVKLPVFQMFASICREKLREASSGRNEIYHILLLALTMAEGLVVAYDYSPVAVNIASELNLSYSDIGALQTYLFIPFMLVQIPAGLLADRFDSKRIILLAVPAMFVASVVFVASRDILMLSFSRILTGASLGFVFVPVVRYLLVSISKYGAGFSLGILGGMQAAGSILASFAPALLSTLTGSWRIALLLLASPLVVLFFLVTLIHENKRVAERSSLKESLRLIILNRFSWIIGYGNFVRFGTVVMMTTWIPTYLIKEYTYRLVSASTVLALVWVFATFSSLLGGYLSDRGRGAIYVIVVGLLITASLLALVPRASNGAVVVTLFLVLGMSMYFAFSPMFKLLPTLIGMQHSGAASGMENTFATFGAAIFPFLMGYLKDTTGDFSYGWYISSVLVFLAALLSLYLFLPFGSRPRGG